MAPLVLLVVLILASSCAAPNSQFAASAIEGNAPLEIEFSPEATSEGATFSWDFGDGTGSQERVATHTYETAGEFTVRLTVGDARRNSFSETVVKVEPGAGGWVELSSDKDTLLGGESVQLTARGFDYLGNPVPDATFEWEAAAEAGTVTADGLFTASATLGTFEDAVTATFERLDAVGSGALDVSIQPGPIARIVIEPADLDLIVGQRIPLGATVLDEHGTVIEDANVTFSALRPGDSTTSGGELTVGSEATGGRAELVEVTASRGSDSFSQTYLGTVKPSVLDQVVVVPQVVQLTVNEQVSLQATGQDRFGNAVALDEVEYALFDDGVGEITGAGVFTASNRATALRDSAIEVKAWSGGVWRKTQVPLRVVPGPAVSIEILPSGDSVPMGAGSPMVAVVRDEYGNEIADPQVQWASGAGGSITGDGVFIAGFEAGEFVHTIIATVMAGAEGNAEPLGTTEGVTVRPRSSDMIAVDVSIDADSDIALIDLRTSSIDVLVEELPGDGTANESGATWYPDGSRLAFSSDASGTSQIYDYHIESGEVRQLTDDPNGATMPAVSPDGTRIAWVSRQNDRLWQIYAAEIPVAPDGEDLEPIEFGSATRISKDDEVQSLLPYWSPDGTEIAYTTSRSVSDNDVRIAAADGSGDGRVISESGYAGLGWSPDGTEMRAVVAEGNLTGLLVDIDVATGDVVQSVPIPIMAFAASWSPDATEAAVIDRFTGDLWLTDVDGTGLRVTLSGSAGASRIAWRPVSIDGPLEATPE